MNTARAHAYDDEVDVRTRATLLSPVRMRFDYDIVRCADSAAIATGYTVHATIDRTGRPVRMPARVKDLFLMKALVTGGAGFIGSHLSERLLAQGAEVVALDAFTDFYPRPLKEANLAGLRGKPGYRFVEGDIRAVDLRRPPRRGYPRVPPGGAGGCPAKLGQRVPGLHRPQCRLDAAPARSVRRPADRAPRVRVEFLGLRR